MNYVVYYWSGTSETIKSLRASGAENGHLGRVEEGGQWTEQQVLSDLVIGRDWSVPSTRSAPQIAVPTAVGTTTTTIHDAFDGWPNSPAVNEPGNGGAWVFLASGEIRAPQPPFTSSNGFLDLLGSLNDTGENGNAPIHEENISLPGTSFPAFITGFLRREPASGALLEQQTLFEGLTQVMLNFGADPNEIGRLYDLHQPTDTCPSYGPASASSPPPPPLYVCPAGSTLTNGQCVSSITPPG